MKTMTEQTRTPPTCPRAAIRKLAILFALVSAAVFAWMALT